MRIASFFSEWGHSYNIGRYFSPLQQDPAVTVTAKRRVRSARGCIFGDGLELGLKLKLGK